MINPQAQRDLLGDGLALFELLLPSRLPEQGFEL
jgi:hypothetical protein